VSVFRLAFRPGCLYNKPCKDHIAASEVQLMPYEIKFIDYITQGEDVRILVDRVEGEHPEHTHDFVEIAYIDSGRGKHIINGREECIGPGDLFMLNQGVTHGFRSEGGPLIVYNCLFMPLTLDSTFKDCTNFLDVAYRYLMHSARQGGEDCGYIRLSGLKTGKIESVLYEMREEFEKKPGGYLQIMKAHLVRLLIEMFRTCKSGERQRQYLPEYRRLVVQEAVSYLKTNYAGEIECEQLAERAYLSVNYFRKIFKEITGMTMIEMLQNIRINVACALLEETDLPVAEVAGRVGYADMKHFYKIFKRAKGDSPGTYRKRNALLPPIQD
jgi:AraC family L-rhamnose operon transcriptional activator RhaR